MDLPDHPPDPRFPRPGDHPSDAASSIELERAPKGRRASAANSLPQHIIFVGPGGVGKTTLAAEVAAALDFPFYDLDDMFCSQIMNIRSFIRQNGYAAYSRRNGELLVTFLDARPDRMVVALSSGVLSEDMAEPQRADLVSKVTASGAVFLIVPHVDDEHAAITVAERQVRRGFGLLYELERQKYLRRITEYRRLGLPEIVVSSKAAGRLPLVLDRIGTCARNGY